jgi:hypothetical protein
MTVIVAHYAGLSEQQITAAVNDRINRAQALEDEEQRTMALDYAARLITELRIYGIWPARYQEPRP